MENKDLERQQAKRFVIAMAALLVVVPILTVILIIPGVLLVEYLWGGMDAIARALADWTKPSPYIEDGRFRLCLLIVFAVAIVLPVLLWNRIFYTSGYVSAETGRRIASGDWPLIGGCWKPFMYFGFCYGSAFGVHVGMRQQSIIGVIFFGLGFLWFTFNAFQDFLRWLHRRK